MTASLPAAVLLAVWCKRGRIRGREWAAMAPFFAAGIAFGLLMAWMERRYVLAEGADWSLTFLQRILLAGRLFWFYLGKLAGPTSLAFFYERWTINPASFVAWLYPAGAVVAFELLWKWRNQRFGRAPLAAELYFAGTLFPALGFFNVYPFRYSWAADHFQYLASIGPLAFMAWAGARGIEQMKNTHSPREQRGRAWFIGGVFLLVFGGYTAIRCGVYRNQETLWTDTIAKTPTSWAAHHNLGLIYLDSGRAAQAVEQFRATLVLRPDYADARNNLGNALVQLGRVDEAIEMYRAGLRQRPEHSLLLNNLARALTIKGDWGAAIEIYRGLLARFPNDGTLRNNLGAAMAMSGRIDEAIEQFEAAVRADPAREDWHRNLEQARRDAAARQKE